ncbi:flagellar biosynthesis protein FlgN [Halanaerobacter jeridensis]|uniref:Nuclease with TOPRIM domain n=1 Tax=Halanaerobacter jeridensis TaxID=706427 RepID=A0A938XTK2_9FIRM|nr:flagellar biosynthesis protein FlgN [Halanaerobacter jeridensis]MBM7557283.1 putative nuclease with TOPRIM domain [Halanaerobacter jeridensis]
MIFIKDKLEGLLKQIELYEDLLAFLEQEYELLEKGEDTTEVKEKQRELRDEIADLDTEYNLKQGEKLRLISENDVEELNQFKPLLKEIYNLEQKNQKLADNS